MVMIPDAATPRRRVLVVYNPAAGKDRQTRLTEVTARLRNLGCTVTARETLRRGDAERFAATAAAAEFDVLVAAGGDGTINEVVNGLVAGGSGLPLALLPLGTANVLALEIGLDPRDGEAVARTIAHGPIHDVHPGVANGRHFMLMVGAGLDAHVVEGVSAALKRRAGRLAYVVESLRQAFGYDFPELRIRANGATYEGHMAIACKGRFYGGPFVAAPGARLDRPKLEVCILSMAGIAAMMRYGLALPLNKLASLPDVTHVFADKVVILGPRGAPVQGDGDIVARLPAEIGIAEETVRLVMPE